MLIDLSKDMGPLSFSLLKVLTLIASAFVRVDLRAQRTVFKRFPCFEVPDGKECSKSHLDFIIRIVVKVVLFFIIWFSKISSQIWCFH